MAKPLKELILEDELKTGQRLPPEREIAKLFNVSRTGVRGAIHTLAAKHLVELTVAARSSPVRRVGAC